MEIKTIDEAPKDRRVLLHVPGTPVKAVGIVTTGWVTGRWSVSVKCWLNDFSMVIQPNLFCELPTEKAE